MYSPLKARLGCFPQGAEVSFYRAEVCGAMVCLLGEFMVWILGLGTPFCAWNKISDPMHARQTLCHELPHSFGDRL